MGDNIYEQKRAKWILRCQEQFPGSRTDVLQFIWDVNCAQGTAGEEIIHDLFASGYCYYFARMLQDAFGGDLFWHKGYGHIVWGDGVDSIYYDISGVFYDYCADSDIVNYRELGGSLESFRHRGHDGDATCEISNAASIAGLSIDDFAQKIYEAIPEQNRILPYYNMEDVERYWPEYKKLMEQAKNSVHKSTTFS